MRWRYVNHITPALDGGELQTAGYPRGEPFSLARRLNVPRASEVDVKKRKASCSCRQQNCSPQSFALSLSRLQKFRIIRYIPFVQGWFLNSENFKSNAQSQQFSKTRLRAFSSLLLFFLNPYSGFPPIILGKSHLYLGRVSFTVFHHHKNSLPCVPVCYFKGSEGKWKQKTHMQQWKYTRERNQGSPRIVLVRIRDCMASPLLEQTLSPTARRVGAADRNYLPRKRCFAIVKSYTPAD